MDPWEGDYGRRKESIVDGRRHIETAIWPSDDEDEDEDEEEEEEEESQLPIDYELPYNSCYESVVTLWIPGDTSIDPRPPIHPRYPWIRCWPENVSESDDDDEEVSDDDSSIHIPDSSEEEVR